MSDFAERARADLDECDISLRAAARTMHIDPGHLSRVLSGKRPPTPHLAEALDGLVGAEGALADLAATLNEDDRGRIARSVAEPARVDLGTVHALADVLAAQRRLDDTLPATAMLSGTSAQWETVERLARDARGPHADALREVAAEWVQFVGWLHAEARNDADAVRWLTEAQDRADDVGSGELAAQAANFKGYLARRQGRPRAIVRWFSAAYYTPGAAPLQRVGDAVQAAHGYALLGERDTARRLLGEASDLADAAADTEAPGTAYWLSPTFSRMGMGLVHLALDEHAEAAANLRAGLDGLPLEQRCAEWSREYRDALEEARAA
ncbi:helix-turn-helix domain-containing protein [Streptomonospora salina]|uniref:Transcriptional regulator with XRE-family HTH domain n=1 Tax=Streptomonospora salina TaxID=104205 RepID=A0A841E352_9ACTN|nr:helix-turn-helix transcriptional regulator [Streptomonospora salina]MBB5998247.1 transcriptional regulator with XRE-family HTH domain [Streptomonospora salina]